MDPVLNMQLARAAVLRGDNRSAYYYAEAFAAVAIDQNWDNVDVRYSAFRNRLVVSVGGENGDRVTLHLRENNVEENLESMEQFYSDVRTMRGNPHIQRHEDFGFVPLSDLIDDAADERESDQMQVEE